MDTSTRITRRELVGTAISVVAAVACKSHAPHLAEPNSRFGRDFLPDWELSKQVTLEFAQAMPEEYYDYKPTPELRSFAEHMLHIAESSIVNVARFVKGEKPPDDDLSAYKTKAQIIAYLERALDYVAQVARELSDEEADEVVAFPEGSRPRRKIFWYTRDHMTHHRGQTVPYYRLKGVVPPRWRG